MGDAVLLLGLRRRHLVVALVYQLAIDNVVDGIGAPRQRINGPAARTAAAAPLVGEEHLRAVVVERRRMPVSKAGVGDEVEPLWIPRIADVHQDAVARARARRQTHLR